MEGPGHRDRLVFWEHVAGFLVVNALLAYARASFWPGVPWDYWVPAGWGVGLGLHGLWAYGRLR